MSHTVHPLRQPAAASSLPAAVRFGRVLRGLRPIVSTRHPFPGKEGRL